MSSHSNNIIAGDQALLMGVFGFGHQPDGQYGPEAKISNKIIIPNNICLSNFALESLPVGVLDHALCTPCRCCRGWTPPRWSWWFRNKKFQTWLSSQTTFVQSTLAWHQSLGVSLIRLYSWLMEWLDTTQMVMVVWKQWILKHHYPPKQLLLS